MKMRDVTVTVTNLGRKYDAKQMICDDCQGDLFKILFLGKANHQHVMCVSCNMSYCNSDCKDDPELQGQRSEIND